MGHLSGPYAYSTVEMEDPDERTHRRAQPSIARILKKSDSISRRSSLRLRICRLKIKIGKRMKRLRKRMQLVLSVWTVGVHRIVPRQLKIFKDVVRSKEGDVSVPLFCGD